jgi:hypothetical protein
MACCAVPCWAGLGAGVGRGRLRDDFAGQAVDELTEAMLPCAAGRLRAMVGLIPGTTDNITSA